MGKKKDKRKGHRASSVICDEATTFSTSSVLGQPVSLFFKSDAGDTDLSKFVRSFDFHAPYEYTLRRKEPVIKSPDTCQSLSPLHQFQCTKDPDHQVDELDPTHQNGNVIWRSGMNTETNLAPGPFPFKTRGEVLADWWRQTAEGEIEQTVDKAVEYGATDLIDIGRNIARLSHREVSDQEAAEIGIFFYLEGKLARWRSAISEGRQVSMDTLLDIGVYARMAQRVRTAGSWPGV